jgi:hypothetical protein
MKNCRLSSMVHNAQEFVNSKFQIDLNDPTPFVENTIFIELGLYCSNHCISTVDATIDVL